jgi:hypothetical protein
LNEFKSGGAGYHVLIEADNPQNIEKLTDKFCDLLKIRVPNSIVQRGLDTSFTNSFALWMLSEKLLSQVSDSYKDPLPSQLMAMVNEILEGDISYETNNGSGILQNPLQTLRHFIDYLYLLTNNEISEQQVNDAIENLFSGGSIKLSADGRKGYFLLLDKEYNSAKEKGNYYFAKQLKAIADSMSNETEKISIGGTVMLSYDESRSILNKPKINTANKKGNYFSGKLAILIIICIVISSIAGLVLLTEVEMIKDIKKLNVGALQANVTTDKILKKF